MAIIERMSVKALPIETQNRFAAQFNVPTLGQYDFGVAANTQQVVIANLNPNFVYLIDRVSFSASIPEGVYLESVNVTPQARLSFLNTEYGIYPRPLPGVNYKDNLEWRFFFWTEKRNDQLLVTFDGALNQVAATVGVPIIYANLSFVIYEENNLQICQRIKEQTSKCAGEFYRYG